MQVFAKLLDSLAFTPSRNAKIRLIGDYLKAVPDPARGYALAALTGALSFTGAKPAVIRALVAERVDPELFAMSYDYVGDLAETAALIWPERPRNAPPPTIDAVVHELTEASRGETPKLLEAWLDVLDADGRWALLKLATGGLRVGVSARLAKVAVAEAFGQAAADIEEVWHGIDPPYTVLFDWLEGRAAMPDPGAGAGFRPVMLANPLEEDAIAKLDSQAYRAEWKWDGVRVQAVSRNGEQRLYTRTGDDISGSFPDVVAGFDFDGVIDGELLVRGEGSVGDDGLTPVAPFSALQQRLGRKKPPAKLQQSAPGMIRAYDILFDGDEDVRKAPFDQRRLRLETWGKTAPEVFDISPLVPFADWDELAAIRAGARADGVEGLMLKRRDAAYSAGRPQGPWFKWKRAPLTLDLVVMYAQRGHGRRSSYFSDYTFGAWTDDDALVPVGKAYSGFTDKELALLDKWVRANTTDRFGPVRQVAPGLVFEVAFDAAQRSKRHKSGVALRFPRIKRIRWDKPIEEADRLSTVLALADS
jgi:DNA ligase-1